MSKIIGRVKITFHNGTIQERDVITQDDFENIVKVKKGAIADLGTQLSKIKDNKNPQYIGIANRISEIKKELSSDFGDNFITDGSPIHDAKQTGILSLPTQQGGDTPCQVINL